MGGLLSIPKWKVYDFVSCIQKLTEGVTMNSASQGIFNGKRHMGSQLFTMAQASRFRLSWSQYYAPTISGWWFEHIWKIWVRQLGWLSPIYGKIKVMFQSPTSQLCHGFSTSAVACGPSQKPSVNPQGGRRSSEDPSRGTTWDDADDADSKLRHLDLHFEAFFFKA